MLWFVRIAEKFDLPASLLYKQANPETLRQLQELKDKVKRERKQLNFRVVRTPRIRELIGTPDQPDMPMPETKVLPLPDTKVASVSFYIEGMPKPIMNLPNLSFAPLNRILKISPNDDYQGSMSGQELLVYISNARKEIDPEDFGGTDGWSSVRERSGFELTQYLDKLEQLAQYALKMNNATISWG